MNLKERQAIRAVVKQDMKNNHQYRDELGKIQSGLSVQQSIDLLGELEEAIGLLEEVSEHAQDYPATHLSREPETHIRDTSVIKDVRAFLDKHRSKP